MFIVYVATFKIAITIHLFQANQVLGKATQLAIIQ